MSPEEGDSWGQGIPGRWSLPLTTYLLLTLCRNLLPKVSWGFSCLGTLFLATTSLNCMVRCGPAGHAESGALSRGGGATGTGWEGEASRTKGGLSWALKVSVSGRWEGCQDIFGCHKNGVPLAFLGEGEWSSLLSRGWQHWC